MRGIPHITGGVFKGPGGPGSLKSREAFSVSVGQKMESSTQSGWFHFHICFQGGAARKQMLVVHLERANKAC